MNNNTRTTVFVATHVTISSSEPDANGFTEVRVFKTKKKALKQFKSWRNEELECRKANETSYVVYSDTDQRFHCTWDADNEGIIVSLKEVEVV